MAKPIRALELRYPMIQFLIIDVILYCKGIQKIIVGLSIIIDYFRVAPNLCLKTRLSGKPMIWKWFFILMQMKLIIITRKALYLALFWKLGLWNTEMAFSSMKHDIHYLSHWFAGFIPDEFAHLYVIRALRKWKQSLLSPYLTVSILMVPFENHFVKIAPKWESPQIQRLPKFWCCFYVNKYCVFTSAENF